MKVAKNTVVTMTYVLHRETADGEIIQETTKEQPFQAIFGAGMLLPKFEENLEGFLFGILFYKADSKLHLNFSESSRFCCRSSKSGLEKTIWFTPLPAWAEQLLPSMFIPYWYLQHFPIWKLTLKFPELAASSWWKWE